MLPDDFFPILHHSNTPLSFVWGTGLRIKPRVQWNNSKGELVIVILTVILTVIVIVIVIVIQIPEPITEQE